MYSLSYFETFAYSLKQFKVITKFKCTKYGSHLLSIALNCVEDQKNVLKGLLVILNGKMQLAFGDIFDWEQPYEWNTWNEKQKVEGTIDVQVCRCDVIYIPPCWVNIIASNILLNRCYTTINIIIGLKFQLLNAIKYHTVNAFRPISNYA